MADPLQKLEKLLNLHSKDNENKIGIAMADKIVFIHFADIIYCEASSAYKYVCGMSKNDNKKMAFSLVSVSATGYQTYPSSYYPAQILRSSPSLF